MCWWGGGSLLIALTDENNSLPAPTPAPLFWHKHLEPWRSPLPTYIRVIKHSNKITLEKHSISVLYWHQATSTMITYPGPRASRVPVQSALATRTFNPFSMKLRMEAKVLASAEAGDRGPRLVKHASNFQVGGRRRWHQAAHCCCPQHCQEQETKKKIMSLSPMWSFFNRISKIRTDLPSFKSWSLKLTSPDSLLGIAMTYTEKKNHISSSSLLAHPRLHSIIKRSSSIQYPVKKIMFNWD